MSSPQLRIPHSLNSLFGKRSSFARYGYAVAVPALATIVTYSLWWWLGSVSPLFFVGVLCVSWYGGLRPGLLASVLSTAACNLVLAQRAGAIAVTADDLLRLAGFMIGTLFISSLMMARHQAEEAVEEAEKQLAITLKSIGDAVITTDANGRITFMNSIAESLTDWRQTDAGGRRIEEVLHLVDTEKGCEAESVVTRVLKDNVVLGLGGSVVMVLRDGTRVPIDEIATPTRDKAGQINGVVLVLRSIPKPEPETREQILSEKIKLLDAVDANMLAIDSDGRCAFVSKSAARLLGYRPYELIGKKFKDLTQSPKGDDLNYSGQWARPDLDRTEKNPISMIETLWCRDRTFLPVKLSISPMIVGKQSVGTVITITDLTERHRAEEAIAKLASIADSVGEGIVIHTSDGVITSWNQAAERIYGYLEEEVLGRHISIIHPPGCADELETLFERVLADEDVNPFETVRIRKGGERVSVSIKASPLYDAGNSPVAVVQIISDLTEKKKAEEAAARAFQNSPTSNRPRAIGGRPYAVKYCQTDAAPAKENVEEQIGERLPVPSRQHATVLLGQSRLMQKLFVTIDRVAPTDSSILITGTTGTGKEIIARAIHDKSLRARGPFVDLNCSAIPETLIEAELFGHQRGTFTGAHENRPGLFEVASGGTLFLDEVDALPAAAQAKLLRVLQERRLRRVGGRTNIAVDVRIVSATNCDLSAAVKEGRFRADLFYRLRVFPIHVPDLREREGDVELLIDHFLKRHANQLGESPRRFTSEAMTALLQHSWPGNVRELESAIEYALAVAGQGNVGIGDLPPEFSPSTKQSPSNLKEILEAYKNNGIPLADLEKHYILSVLEEFDGNQVRAAAALGIDRSKLYRRLRQYGIKAVKFLQEEQRDGMQLLSSRKDESDDSTSDGETRLHRSATSIG